MKFLLLLPCLMAVVTLAKASDEPFVDNNAVDSRDDELFQLLRSRPLVLVMNAPVSVMDGQELMDAFNSEDGAGRQKRSPYHWRRWGGYSGRSKGHKWG